MQERLNPAVTGFLNDVLTDRNGVGVLYGPQSLTFGSGILDEFVQDLQANRAVADVDGSGLRAPEFLSKIIEQFGYVVELHSTDELLNMLRVIVVQQTRVRAAPLLIIRNVNRMYPSALCALCKLAAQRAGNRYALRMLLVGEDYYHRIIDAPAMAPIARRIVGHFELKYESASPVFVVTHAGRTVREFTLTEAKLLIGRSPFCDVRIENQSISRQHAMLMRGESSVAVFDLRSRNGTLVNGHPVERQLLRDSDVIDIGDYRFKAYLPEEFALPRGDEFAAEDTARMMTIEDARRARQSEPSRKADRL